MPHKPRYVSLVAVYSDFFDDDHVLDSLLDGVKKELVFQVCSSLLHRGYIPDSYDFIDEFFSSANNDFATSMKRRVSEIESNVDSGERLVFVSNYALLKIIEYAFELTDVDEYVLVKEAEVRIFKLILKMNDLVYEEGQIFPTEGIKSKDDELNFLLDVSFFQWEIINYSPRKVLVVEVIKAFYLFQFLESSKYGRDLLREFYSEFGIVDWREFLKILIPLFLKVISYSGKSSITLTPSNMSDAAVKIFESFRLLPDDRIKDDFAALRAKPIIKLESGDYLLVWSKFLFEQLHRSAYFRFKGYDGRLAQVDSKKEGFRNYFGKEYSEKGLFYRVLKMIYGGKYKSRTGEELESRGFMSVPDFYLRNGNKVFLFESKETLLRKETIASRDALQIKKEFRKKLYGDNKKKGVRQLVSYIKSMDDLKYAFDEVGLSRVSIYPILVLQNNQFNAAGVNRFLGRWFIEELNNMELGRIDKKKVHGLTVIVLDDMIYYQDWFIRNDWKLDELIKDYQSFVNRKITERDLYEGRVVERHLNQSLSFSGYLADRAEKSGKSIGIKQLQQLFQKYMSS